MNSLWGAKNSRPGCKSLIFRRAPNFGTPHGFHGAFFAGVIIAALGIVASLTLIRRNDLEQPVEELEPALDLAA